MSEKDATKIVYDRGSDRLYLIGSFFSEIATFRAELSSAIYRKGGYDALKDEELKKDRVLRLVLVNCPGGVISEMFAMLGILRLFKLDLPNIDFQIHCVGQIQSAATIFFAADIFSRIIVDRHCSIKIHNVSTTFSKESSFKRSRLSIEAKSSLETETQIRPLCIKKR